MAGIRVASDKLAEETNRTEEMPSKFKELELPLYSIGRRVHANPLSFGNQSLCHIHENQNDLDMLLLAQWEDRASQGLLKYDVTACQTKIIPGRYGFITQLNVEQHLKKQHIENQVKQVLEPFDPLKFNFTEVGQDELLLSIKISEDESWELIPKAFVHNDANLIVVNVCPVEYGHVLLVPRAFCCLPQMIDLKSLELAIEMAAVVNNCFFRIGYNSLGAFATVNHLHFQAYYLANPLPVELARTQLIPGHWQKTGLKILEILDYPVKGLVFEVGDHLEQMAAIIARLCCSLQNKNMPFNLLISDCGARIFLFPQHYTKYWEQGQQGMLKPLTATECYFWGPSNKNKNLRKCSNFGFFHTFKYKYIIRTQNLKSEVVIYHCQSLIPVMSVENNVQYEI